MAFRTCLVILLLSLSQTPALAAHQASVNLPEVDSVMTRAMGKAMDFAEQAKEMQRQVEIRQEESKAELLRIKEKYEKSLKKQADLNDKVEQKNTQLEESIAKQRRENTASFSDAVALQKKNSLLRQTITTIQTKVKAAKEFLAESLKETDDSQAAELNVLVPTTPKPTLDHFLRVAASVQDAPAPAVAPMLLQVRSHLRRRHLGEPGDLVKVLSNSLAEIAEASKEGKEQLEASYLQSLNASQTRYAELMQAQTELNSTLVTLQTEGARLEEAQKHLVNSQRDLNARLLGLAKFAVRVDDFAALGLNASKLSPKQVEKAKARALKTGTSLLAVSALADDPVAKAADAKQQERAEKRKERRIQRRTNVTSGEAAASNESVAVIANVTARSKDQNATASGKPVVVNETKAATGGESVVTKNVTKVARDDKVAAKDKQLPIKAHPAAEVAKASRQKGAKEAAAAAKPSSAKPVPDAKAAAVAKPSSAELAPDAKAANATKVQEGIAASPTSSNRSWRDWFGAWR